VTIASTAATTTIATSSLRCTALNIAGAAGAVPGATATAGIPGPPGTPPGAPPATNARSCATQIAMTITVTAAPAYGITASPSRGISAPAVSPAIRAARRDRCTRARQHSACVASGDRRSRAIPQCEVRDLRCRRQPDDEHRRGHATLEQHRCHARDRDERDEQAEVDDARLHAPGQRIVAERCDAEPAGGRDQQPRHLLRPVALEERRLGERPQPDRHEVRE